MIVFNNWTLTVTGLIARQYDNLSRRIDVEGDLPAGYTWQLLVQSGGNADIILLEATETGVGALLTADNLSMAGEYYIQLRGVLEADGVTKRHTNVVSAYIPESLTGLGTWPEVPTEFAQVEARILELYQHPPIPGSNGYWLVWDTDKGEYVESKLALSDANVTAGNIETALGYTPANEECVTQLKNELSDVEYRLNNGFTTWSNIENGSANGAGIYEDSDRLVTGLIPVKKGWVLRIKHGSLVHGDILWKESVTPANCYLNSSTRYTDYDIEIQHNGFACIVFRYDPVSAISPSDFDGAVEIIDTFYRNVLADIENIRNDVDHKSKELSNDVHNELTGLKESVELSFELGTINTNTGAESTSTTRARSNMFYLSKPMRVASVDDSYTFRPIKYSADGKTCLGALVTYNLSEYQLEEGYSYRLLIFPNGLDSLDGHIDNINNSIIVMLKKSVYVISKDGTGDFDDIQRCLDFISKTEPTTVVVKSGTYDKISTMTQKKYVDDTTGNNNIKWYNRKLNIIGVSQKDCIIKSTTGEYYTPAGEICITGEVRNITFISDHTEPPENRSEDTGYLRHKAYAVHSDAGTEDVLYNNCRMVSYQAPAIGIGGAQDKKVRIRNCHLESYAPKEGEYSPLVNYGGLFYHLQTAAGITGQLFEMEDSYVYSENGDKSVWITPSSGTDYEQVTRLLRNCFYGGICGKTVSIDQSMLSADSYGNNVPSANAS